jgi:hypothetical protein
VKVWVSRAYASVPYWTRGKPFEGYNPLPPPKPKD